MRLFRPFMLALALGLARTASADAGLLADLHQAAPEANPAVLQLAVQAVQCAASTGQPASGRLAVIDYSRPSDQPRLWVFDLIQHTLLFQELVAHGRNSGDNIAQHFSNDSGSLASSIGLFRTSETYNGDNGYSLRMDGLEPGFNDHARERAIVMHGAAYVDPGIVHTLGRLGRSWGCPAIPKRVAKQVIDTLKQGQFLFSYCPDPHWLNSSHYLNCGGTHATVASADTR